MTAAIDTRSHAVFAALADVRTRTPLVHNITNFVAMASSANILLSLGASPAMVHSTEEATDFAAIADALVVNIGTLSPDWVKAMMAAAKVMRGAAKPFVFDPVAAGATPFRGETARQILALKPSIVRGNASEIIALAGMNPRRGEAGRGVDSTAASNEALDAAVRLARESGSIVAVTGERDYATDGKDIFEITGGSELMPLATALGCGLSAVIAAFAAVRPPLAAAVAGLAVYAAAGRIAGARCEKDGPGYLTAELCNALYRMDEAGIADNAAIKRLSP